MLPLLRKISQIYIHSTLFSFSHYLILTHAFKLSCYDFISQLNLHWDLRSLVAQMVKCLPTVWETEVQSLGREDLREKKMATHSRILAWRIPWTEGPCRLQSVGHKSQTRLSDFTSFTSLLLPSNHSF